MGLCVSLIRCKPRTLDSFCNEHMMPYPGDRVTISTLMLHWVWQRDVGKIVKYLHDEDPHGDRKIAERVRDTLDCVRHFRDRSRKPFLTKDERRRYEEFNRMRRTGRFAGHSFTTEKEHPEIEFITDYRFI